MATLQVYWSENPKLQQYQEEKSAYYFDNQISLHAMYSMLLWIKEKKKSIASLSDCTDYKAAAVVTSLKEILSNLITQGKTKINIIRDSPLQGFPYLGAWGGESPPPPPPAKNLLIPLPHRKIPLPVDSSHQIFIFPHQKPIPPTKQQFSS